MANEAGVLVEPPVRKAVHYIVRMYERFISSPVHTAPPGLEKTPDSKSPVTITITLPEIYWRPTWLG